MSSHGNRKSAISIFCLSYLLATLIWLCPPCPTRDCLVDTYGTLYNFVGLNQGWSVFAPRLRNINFHSTAIITYSDGTTELWEIPRMNKLTYWERFQKEKWRKWGSDTMPWPNYAALWPDVARFIARQHRNPTNPPKQVSLNLHWIEIPAECPRDALPEHTKFYTFYVYHVSPEDLKA